jgi:Domain of unknown function (DUF4145)
MHVATRVVAGELDIGDAVMSASGPKRTWAGALQMSVFRVRRIAELSPRAAILEVRSELEDALRAVIQSAKLPTPQAMSMAPLTRLLRKEEIIDAQTSALLDDLRVIGNNAAHRPDTQFTKDDALRYRSLADQAISHMKAVIVE